MQPATLGMSVHGPGLNTEDADGGEGTAVTTMMLVGDEGRVVLSTVTPFPRLRVLVIDRANTSSTGKGFRVSTTKREWIIECAHSPAHSQLQCLLILVVYVCIALAYRSANSNWQFGI